MNSPEICVADFDQKADIVYLAKAVNHGKEPGFQVDGVETVDDFLMLEQLLRKGAPALSPRSGHFDGALEVTHPTHYTGPHVDAMKRFVGFAIHHSRGHEYPVHLGLIRRLGWQPYFLDSIGHDNVRKYRVGSARDGRLTIFSEGHRFRLGFDLRTAHYFGRTTVGASSSWARFSYSRFGSCDRQAVLSVLDKRFTT